MPNLERRSLRSRMSTWRESSKRGRSRRVLTWLFVDAVMCSSLQRTAMSTRTAMRSLSFTI